MSEVHARKMYRMSRKKTALVWFLNFVYCVIGVTSVEVIYLSINVTSGDTSSLKTRTEVLDGVATTTQLNTECECGKNSYGCSFLNGEKNCFCNSGYTESDGTCREVCYLWHPDECENGGKCKNSVCECLPGTHGDRCEIVDGCEDWVDVYKKCGQTSLAFCAFNHTSGTSYCKCSLGSYAFDDYNKECKRCDCGSHGDCYFLQGEKTCDCYDGYSERPGGWYGESSCEPCDCGVHSTGCGYTSYASIECSCDSGYAERHNECEECSCGPYGDCSFDENGQKVCNCQSGYADKNGFCEVCDCGSNTECEFDDYEEQICRCRSGYGYKNGVCTQCDCFWNFLRANCTFSYGIQKCTCPKGFEEKTKNYCTDIDECKDNPSICPRNSVCLNTFGSYECNCNSGYRPHSDNLETKRYGCTDVDECEEINECPFRDTSQCINTQGSFYCVCKPGYHTKSATSSIEFKGCLEDQTSWRIGYIILIIVFFFISTVLLIAICKRRLSC